MKYATNVIFFGLFVSLSFSVVHFLICVSAHFVLFYVQQWKKKSQNFVSI